MADRNSRQRVLLIAALVVGVLGGPSEASSDFPNKPIQMVVAWSAGASEDIRARALAPTLEKVLGQPVVVINKPRAAGTLGMTLLGKSKPDGYTLFSSSGSPTTTAPHVQKVEYNPLTDFTFIAGTATQPLGINVRSDARGENLNELIKYVKENPGKVKLGSSRIGISQRIYMEMLGKDRELNWVQVPFKGDQPQITVLLGEHILLRSMSSAFAPHVRSGKIRLMAILGNRRIAAFPQVPALKEFGGDIDLRGGEVLGFAGPKGLPPEIVTKLESAFKQAVESPEYKKVMEQLANEANFRDSLHQTESRT